MKIHMRQLGYNQNHNAGDGYYIMLFDWLDENQQPPQSRLMLASVFNEMGIVSVVELMIGTSQQIQCADTAWQGEDFETLLRKICVDLQEHGEPLMRIEEWHIPTPEGEKQ